MTRRIQARPCKGPIFRKVERRFSVRSVIKPALVWMDVHLAHIEEAHREWDADYDRDAAQAPPWIPHLRDPEDERRAAG